MAKKYILLFIFISLLAFAVPSGAVLAANYFVGVTISSGQAPGYPAGTTNTNWCLPAYTDQYSSFGFRFYIRNQNDQNLTPVSPTTNPVNLVGPACALDTVWSGLFNLTSGQTYKAYFQGNSYSSCSGVYGYNGKSYYCWNSWDTPGQNKSCAQVCEHYNSQLVTYSTGGSTYAYQYMYPDGYDSANCGLISRLMGGTCSSCTTNATAGNYYHPTTYACYQTSSYYVDNDQNGQLQIPDVVRVCPCQLSDSSTASFSFNFTPTF